MSFLFFGEFKSGRTAEAPNVLSVTICLARNLIYWLCHHIFDNNHNNQPVRYHPYQKGKHRKKTGQTDKAWSYYPVPTEQVQSWYS